MTVKSLYELVMLLRQASVRQFNYLLRSEDVQGPWRSYKADTTLLPSHSTPRRRTTVDHAINSVNNVVDLVGVGGEIIDKATWTINHHCARLLLLWSKALAGADGPLKGVKDLTRPEQEYNCILFDVYAKLEDDHVVPNLLSAEPGVKLLWQWMDAPGEPENEASRGVKTLTFNEAKQTVSDIFKLASNDCAVLYFYHAEHGSRVYHERHWVELIDKLKRKIRSENRRFRNEGIRQITIEVHTIGPGIWMSPSANFELAEARQDMEFLLYQDTV